MSAERFKTLTVDQLVEKLTKNNELIEKAEKTRQAGAAELWRQENDLIREIIAQKRGGENAF